MIKYIHTYLGTYVASLVFLHEQKHFKIATTKMEAS